MPSIVLDSSVAMAWVLDDEGSTSAERAVKAAFESTAHVPTLWLYEIQNVLVLSVRRGRLTLEDARNACDLLTSIPISVHAPQGIGWEFDVATPAGLTAYDAAYLCVARDLNLPLATLDKRLAQTAYTLGIALFEA